METQMPLTVQTMMEAANAAVERIDHETAQKLLGQGALLLDVRDTVELESSGQALDAHHIPRGMLEFRADPATKYHDPELQFDRPVMLFCASGGRAALAGKLLKDMGYDKVYNLGGLGDWNGAKTEPADPGM